MSAPDTNIDKQEKRHKPALLGIKGAVLFGGLMLVLVVVFSLSRSDDEAAGPGVEGIGGAEMTEPVDPGTNAGGTADTGPAGSD